MGDKENTYKALSPIKRNGKMYKAGDKLKLTEAQAKGLNVKKSGPAKSTGEDSNDGAVYSKDMSADNAVEHIQSTDAEHLEGFLSEDEKRKTVLAAWNEKFPQESEQSESQS